MPGNLCTRDLHRRTAQKNASSTDTCVTQLPKEHATCARSARPRCARSMFCMLGWTMTETDSHTQSAQATYAAQTHDCSLIWRHQCFAHYHTAARTLCTCPCSGDALVRMSLAVCLSVNQYEHKSECSSLFVAPRVRDHLFRTSTQGTETLGDREHYPCGPPVVMQNSILCTARTIAQNQSQYGFNPNFHLSHVKSNTQFCRPNHGL